MRNILFVLTYFFVFIIYGQESGVTIQESKTYKMTTARVQNDYILPDQKGGFITISSKRSGFLANPLVYESYLTHYDNKMELIAQQTVKLNKGSIKGNIKGAFIRDNKLNLVNLEANHRKKYYAFNKLIGDIDANEMLVDEEFFRIPWIYPKTEVNLFVNLNSLYYQKLKYYSDVNFFNPKIFIRFSENNKFFTIVYRALSENQVKYYVKVFNDDYNLVYEQELTKNIPAKLFYFNDISVDDKTGTVFLGAKIYKTDPLYKNRFLNTDNLEVFEIYQVSKDDVSKFVFKPQKVVEDIHLVLSDNQLTVFAFYRNKYTDLNNVDGIIRFNLSSSGLHILKQKYQEFSDKFIPVGQSSGVKKNKNHKMVVRNAFVTANNELIVNAEDLYIPLMMKKKDREAKITEIAGDILSVKLADNGELIWADKIYKSQVVKPRLALHSFFNAYINQTNHIIFTDSRLEKPEKKIPFYQLKKELQNLYDVGILSSGTPVPSTIFKPNRSKFRFMPIEGTMIAPNQAIIPAKDHQFIKFYKLTF